MDWPGAEFGKVGVTSWGQVNHIDVEREMGLTESRVDHFPIEVHVREGELSYYFLQGLEIWVPGIDAGYVATDKV